MGVDEPRAEAEIIEGVHLDKTAVLEGSVDPFNLVVIYPKASRTQRSALFFF